MTNNYSIILTTYSDDTVGKTLIEGLLAERLAACIQVLDINSYYRWKGSVNNDRERLLLIKTRSDLYAKVEQFIRSHHSYETPEIVQLPITAGLPDYLLWIDKEVS